jgi:hypothetical protein
MGVLQFMQTCSVNVPTNLTEISRLIHSQRCHFNGISCDLVKLSGRFIINGTETRLRSWTTKEWRFDFGQE